MVKHFKREEINFVSGMPICPDCIEDGHKQGSTEKFLDCKNTFGGKEEHIGQCCCYSKEHGKKEG